ncbi:MAG: winged helix DNA-binding domain-containing protein [Bacteroidota bacterium]
MPLDIVSYRLHNQYLSHHKFNQAAEIIRSLGAVQAQDFGGAKWAIGLRSEGLTDADVTRSFDNGSILRTHMLRPTWHFAAPEDIRWMLALTAPRVRAQIAFLDRQLEVDRNIIKKSSATLVKALRNGKHLTRRELEPVYQRAGIPTQGIRIGHILMHAELDGLICSGPRKGKQFTYALLEERVPPAKAKSREESLAELVRRYFLTRGPATLQDFSWWSGLTMKDARDGIEMVQSQFVRETIDGQIYWFAESGPLAPETSPAVHLLPNYDEFVVGYKDRSAIGNVAAQTSLDNNEQAMLAYVVLLNGQVVGGWKRSLGKQKVDVQVNIIPRLTLKEQQALSDAVERFGKFLGLPTLFVHKEYKIEQRTSRSF